MSEKFDRLIALLERDLKLTGTEIAEILWLAARRSSSSALTEETGDEGEQKDLPRNAMPIAWLLLRQYHCMAGILFLNQFPTPSESPRIDTTAPSTTSCAALPQRSPPAQKSPIAGVYPKTADGSDSVPISLPDVSSLRHPLKIARSLRPLMQRIPSGKPVLLDEAATVERTAELEGLLSPVLKPFQELRFDLGLVVDESDSMIFWRRTTQELQKLCKHYGIFRHIRTWGMVTNDRGKICLRQEIGKKARRDRLYRPQTLSDPSGRRLILVVSDCVGAVWRNGKAFSILETWGKQNVVAIVQMLPARMWLRTGLSSGTMAQLDSRCRPAVANRNLAIAEILFGDEPEGKPGLKVPVFSLEPDLAETWSEMAIGKGTMGATGFVFPPASNGEWKPAVTHSQSQERTSGERFYDFRMSSSRTARELASLLAAAPIINLPIVRLIQRNLLRESQQVHVAEVFLGGILQSQSAIAPETNPDEVQYRFIDEYSPSVDGKETIRDLLIEDSPRAKSVQIFTVISEYFARRMGKNLQAFYGLLRNPEALKQVPTENLKDFDAQRFAEIATRILKQLGEPYARLAAAIEAAWQDETPGSKPQRYALAVGIAEYESPRLKGSSSCVKDAEAVAQLLEQYGDCRVTRLQGKVTGLELEEALNDLFAPASANEEVILYFAGYGDMEFASSDSGEYSQGFLLTSDSQIGRNSVLHGAISYHRLSQLIQRSPHLKSLTLIIDTSHSGALIEEIEPEWSPFPEGVDCSIIASFQAHESAYESQERGLFTGVLLEALAPENANAEGEISAAQAWEYINRAFNEESESTHRQTPLYFSSGKSPILLKYPVVAPSLDTRQLEAFLQQQQWQEADRETERLIRLAAGQQSTSEKIGFASLARISCTDWQEIDRLWQQYSDQCFGLGTQLSIWQRDDDNSATYHKRFGDRVGWGRLERGVMHWRELDALDFSLTAPPGHLPRAWYKNCGGTLKDIFSFLGERWAECGIEQPSPQLIELRESLAAGNWEQADLVTAQLIGNATDISTFSCDLLRAIDQLWVRYSNGRFGFSVQKGLCRNLDIRTNEDDPHQPFVRQACFEQIGWGEGNGGAGPSTENYDWMTYDLNAPPGHLPHECFVESYGSIAGTVFVNVERMAALLNRLEACQILTTFSFETVTVNRRGEIIKRETRSAQYFSETLQTQQIFPDAPLRPSPKPPSSQVPSPPSSQVPSPPSSQVPSPPLSQAPSPPSSQVPSPPSIRQDSKSTIQLDMVAIPGGTFMMGSPEGEGYNDEHPQHKVTVQPFFMGKTPITQEQWRAIASRTDLKVERNLDPDPSRFKDAPDPETLPPSSRESAPTRWDRPVELVSWYDAMEFCARLSRLTGREYRLPSEAEWEYACRAGTTTPFHFGETLTAQLANYDANNTYADEPKGEYREQITPVGSFPPNAFGLYDLHGNVWEWCVDDWHNNYEKAPTDGKAWLNKNNSQQELSEVTANEKSRVTDDLTLENTDNNNSQLRKVLRGGSWINYPDGCRSALRYGSSPDDPFNYDGFRVVCVGSGRTL